MPIDGLAAGAPVLRLTIPGQVEPSALIDQLAPITGVVIALALTIWAVIRSEVIRGFVQDAADRAEVYIDRHEHSDRPRHDVTVPAAKAVNWAILRHFSTSNLSQLKRHLGNEGFSWLDRDDFEDVCDPEICWRRPFRFSEVREGYAIERERPIEGRPNFVEELVEELQDEHARALIDLPGSGKSTICKLVASRWDADGRTGPVLYRTSGQNPLSDQQRVEEAIDEATRRGRVLVVVEDAARADVVQIYQIVSDYRSADDVCFLLDSHEHKWENFDETLRTRTDFGLEARKELRSIKNNVPRITVPALDQPEVTRVVNRFEKKTGRNVTISAADLLQRIKNEKSPKPVDVGSRGIAESLSGSGDRANSPWASPMLLLTYYLPVTTSWRDDDSDGRSLVTDAADAFHKINYPNDTEVFDVESEDVELLKKIGLLVNVLNAADIGVYEELIHSLAETERDHKKIQGILERFQGRLIFGKETQTRYWSHHGLWSELYLNQHLEQLGPIRARPPFETVVNTLLSFISDEERESRMPPELRETPLTIWIDENPQLAADSFVEDIFNIGLSRATLAPLFGRTGDSAIHPPDVCSDTIEAWCSIWRGNMYLYSGDLENAQEEFNHVVELANDGDVPSDRIEIIRATNLNNLGLVARKRGDLETAQEYHDQSLVISQEAGDRHIEAASLNNLGVVAGKRGDIEVAREYFEQSLAIYREIDDSHGEAMSLNELGVVAKDCDNHEAAEEYLKESLAISRETGDRHIETQSLNNLGLVLGKRGDLRAAEEYHKQSLAIKRELGYRHGEAQTFTNLGGVARKRDDLETAEEYLKESLAISREVGDRHGEARNLNGLGLVAADRDDIEAAEEYFERSLAAYREVGDSHGRATNLYTLGDIALMRDDFVTAEEYHEQSLAISREIGDRHNEAKNLNNLGRIAEERNKLQTAEEYFEQSLAISREVGDRHLQATGLNNLGLVAEQRDNLEAAKEYFEQSLAISREVGDRQGEVTSLTDLGLVARKRDELEAAEEYFEEAIETSLIVGDLTTVFTAIEDIVGVCERRHTIEEAIEWCDQATALAEQSGDDETVERFQNLRSSLTDE